MARVLGYGGLANTNGTRDFSGKEETVVADTVTCIGMGIHQPSAKVNLGGWLGRLILALRFNYGNA
jgi:hypothetical protein